MSREELYSRIPEIWRRLDTEGVLDRFFGVMDWEFDRIHDLIDALLDLQNVNALPDRFLPLLGTKVGHRWRSEKNHAWNRRRIEHAIERYSYKGTYECIKDLVAEHGGQSFEIVDIASKLLIWNRQGRWSRGDSHFLAANLWHDGAFLLRVDDQLSLVDFLVDFELVKAAGEVWFIEVSFESSTSSETTETTGSELTCDVDNLLHGRWNIDLFHNRIPAGPTDTLMEPLQYQDSTSRIFGRYNTDLFFNRIPAGPTSAAMDGGALTASGATFGMGGVWTMGRTDITMSWEPVPIEVAVIQQSTDSLLEAI